jgi:uncharacterized SAM-binding protein YcdF (DUF218 family)
MSGLDSVTDEDWLGSWLMREAWRLLRWPLALLGAFSILLAGWLLWLVVAIQIDGSRHSTRNADVAIVLGAGVTRGEPSAAFDARIRHAVDLYKAGRVHRLLMTGTAFGKEPAEALAGRDRAIALGVPSQAILIETRSWTTSMNFSEARKVMQANGAKTALVVTEPLHMMRSLRMARDLGMDVAGEPTPATFYQDWGSWYRFLRSEILLYHRYLAYGY